VADNFDKSEHKAQGLLRKNANRSVVQVVAQFEPQITFAKKLPNVAESVLKKIKTIHWNSTITSVLIRATDKRYIYHFDFQTFYCQTLGLGPWIDNLPEHAEIFSNALNKMDVSKLRTASFKVTTQIDMLMSHRELSELIIESYLQDISGLKSTHGIMDDILIHLYGNQNGMKSQTTIAPQNADQAKTSFLAIGNHDAFVEPKYIDTKVSDHIRNISVDCLAIVVEMSKKDVGVASLREFLDDSLKEVERIMEGTVLRIKGLKPTKGGLGGKL
jgi:hypothetical protein